MEKIIYNTKLKKISISVLIFMMLFNFIFPNIVRAGLENVVIEKKNALSQDYKATGTIQDVMSSMKTSTMDGETRTIGGILRRVAGDSDIQNFEKMVKEAIKEYILNTNYADKATYAEDKNVEKLYHDNKNNSKIKVTVVLVYTTGEDPRPNSEYKGMGYYYTLGFTNPAGVTIDDLSEQEIKDTIAKEYGEGGITRVDSGSYAATEDGIVEIQTDAQGNEIENEMEEANLGGILLSPVFYLINFIADAIVSNLEAIMDPDASISWASLSGTKVLKANPTEPEEGKKYQEYEVNTESFEMLGMIQYPDINYTPEKIFAGGIELLSIDFISGKNSDGEKITGDWANIRNVISQWYQVLRMIAIIGLLSVLIYTGIKIIISANAKDKAKYKEWIMNWFMAVAILFAMHYIMAFIVSVTGEFSKLIQDANQGIKIVTHRGEESVTNLMGLVRFMIQSENFYVKVGYEVMYIALLVYTIKFTIVYLKRVLNMAFLTLIAPIVALTYPIDKINDGNSQGFNMWLKEYIFNALLQPMHLILYYILVGSSVSIAASNPIYGIVVLAFMTEAEKLLKKIFGFDKAGGGTVGGMTGAFAAGAIASNIKNIARMAGGNGKKSVPGGDKNNNIFENPKPTQGLDVGQFGSGTSIREENEEQQPTTQQLNPNSTEDTFSGMSNDVTNEMQNMQTWQQQNRTQREEEEPDEDEMLKNTVVGSDGFEHNLVHPTTSQKIKEKLGQIKNSKQMKGMKAVGKKVMKPVWDFEHGAAYNGDKLIRKIGRAGLGVSLGIGAAAVQAGISITDGKYNPAEGFATFAAGYAGAGQITKGIENLEDTYTAGALDGDKKAIMKRAQEKWADREDVIAFNKANYKPEDRKEMARKQSEHLLPYGFDLKEMKSVAKYAEKLMTSEGGGLLEADAYKRAANTYKLKQEVQNRNSKAIYNKTERGKYIDTMLGETEGEERARLKKAYENGFNSIIAFDNAQQ